MRILVIAAHPDDEVLGCGATCRLRAQQGHEVHLLIVAEGITSRYAAREQALQEQLEALRQDARLAAQTLGARGVSFLGLADNRLDTVPLLDVVRALETVIAQVRPEIIYTHHGGDLNIDHAVVSRAVLTATRPMAGPALKQIFFFEVPSSTEWAFQRFHPVFRPNTFVDVSATLEAKIEAMACYRSESRAFPHPRSPEGLRAIAQRWGTVVGRPAAEAFELVWSIEL